MKQTVGKVKMGEIGKSFKDYYGTMFTTSNLEVSEELIQSIHRKVTDPMNAILTRNF